MALLGRLSYFIELKKEMDCVAQIIPEGMNCRSR